MTAMNLCKFGSGNDLIARGGVSILNLGYNSSAMSDYFGGFWVKVLNFRSPVVDKGHAKHACGVAIILKLLNISVEAFFSLRSSKYNFHLIFFLFQIQPRLLQALI
ncbi:hypothetical protein PanWU01x14_035620 [Parasponia andersonii]|uniref:Uncharacterized protein n=1 Tax=Parasponia andersonii TaxID=3476 RepID=A0A2P5DTA4_PARAD|nr:hypothetical protein PanWU01x14_035620 [Parasponia andersonii]